ncbi:olfactory receptor 14A2-like [Conger conger]|uniref:olfactory receptor 14A2-like n=1 Tax=Conger conger TaxID=82655 RepID=UPI002A5A75F6|nr:olfactory receptor 14A2-like [Conger conger]
MENVSAVTSFILTAYTELEDYRYLYFLCFLLVYILTLLANSVLIVAIYTEKALHEPMYLFICNLSVNGVYGSTALLPSMLSHLLSHNYEISLVFCLLQIYCLLSYAVVEFTILAVMSYDRYVAICRPLHYHLLMSPRNVYAAIALSWALPCPHIVMILFSYAQILRICLFASKDAQIKALQTCVPHLLTVIIFSVGSLFEMIQSRFNMNHVSHNTRIFLSIYIALFPPLFNPVIYGIRIQDIKVQIIKLFSGDLSGTRTSLANGVAKMEPDKFTCLPHFRACAREDVSDKGKIPASKKDWDAPVCRQAKKIFNLAPTIDSDDAETGRVTRLQRSNRQQPLLLLLRSAAPCSNSGWTAGRTKIPSSTNLSTTTD